jgi:hypothetical protein
VLVLISAALLAGCSAGAGSTAAPGSADTGSSVPVAASDLPSSAPSSLPVAPATMTFSGSASKQTPVFTDGGTLQVSYKVTSHAKFAIDLDQPDGTNLASVADLSGSAKITTWAYGTPGPVYLDVTAGGPWTITVANLDQSRSVAVPHTFSGSTEITTVPVTFIGGETVSWTYKGNGEFSVDLVSPSDGTTVDNLVDTTGPSDDSTVPYDTGDLALRVTASGAWTVSISQ